MLSTCDSCSLFSLSDIESVESEVFSIQRFRNSAVPHLAVILTSCTAVLPAVLFLFLPVVMVVVVSTCDSFSLSSSVMPGAHNKEKQKQKSANELI